MHDFSAVVSNCSGQTALFVLERVIFYLRSKIWYKEELLNALAVPILNIEAGLVVQLHFNGMLPCMYIPTI